MFIYMNFFVPMFQQYCVHQWFYNARSTKHIIILHKIKNKQYSHWTYWGVCRIWSKTSNKPISGSTKLKSSQVEVEGYRIIYHTPSENTESKRWIYEEWRLTIITSCFKAKIAEVSSRSEVRILQKAIYKTTCTWQCTSRTMKPSSYQVQDFL